MFSLDEPDADTERRVTELVDALARPMFMFRMARSNRRMSKASFHRAIIDIDRIAKEYGETAP
jgi:hypothetical protein